MISGFASLPVFLIPFALLAVLLGLFVYWRPALTIEIQRKFYEKLNWRIEPISMEKELRNTKIMGMFLVIVSVFALLSGFLKRY